jgi:hypothetical protein
MNDNINSRYRSLKVPIRKEKPRDESSLQSQDSNDFEERRLDHVQYRKALPGLFFPLMVRKDDPVSG